MRKLTKDGLAIYELQRDGEPWVVAGPIECSIDQIKQIDPDNLPDGFRWITAEEWEEFGL